MVRIMKHEDTQDGRNAWIDLCNWYEGQGSTTNMIKHLTDDINTFKLTATTHNGVEGYISCFECNLYKLRKLGAPITATVQKHTFLKNILDPNYSMIVEILNADYNKDFNDCIMEICRKASDTEMRSRFKRQLNNNTQ